MHNFVIYLGVRSVMHRVKCQRYNVGNATYYLQNLISVSGSRCICLYSWNEWSVNWEQWTLSLKWVGTIGNLNYCFKLLFRFVPHTQLLVKRSHFCGKIISFDDGPCSKLCHEILIFPFWIFRCTMLACQSLDATLSFILLYMPYDHIFLWWIKWISSVTI